jgi:hypothetical protein
MSLLRRLVVACGTWLVCCGVGAAGLDALEACAAQASPEATGIVALEAQCGGIESALLESGFIEQLPAGWRDTLDRDALDDLASLARRYEGAPTQLAPDPVALRAILEQLASEQVRPRRSWWDAFWEWLRSWLPTQDGDADPWFDRLLDRLAQSAGMLEVIAYVLLAVVVIAAIFFIVHELRIAGVLGGRRRVVPPADAAIAAAGDAAEPAAANLDEAAPRDQPAILLRLLVARLLANGQLRAERSLTHRELAAQSKFNDAEARTRFTRVTELAERALYGFGEGNAAQASTIIAEGRQLLQQLQQPVVAGR